MSESSRAKGGHNRAAALSPERKKEIAAKAAKTRHEMLSATHGSEDNPLRIGDIEIPCYVLEDGTRVLSQRGVISGLGMSSGSSGASTNRADRLTIFLGGKGISPFISSDLLAMIENPIRFRYPGSGNPAFGYPAAILADICDAVLQARSASALQKQQEHIAKQAEILVRGFARVGIIALVDEATGYQEDRARDALERILEEFVAKELQPWLSTFPIEFYKELFRIRGLSFPGATVRKPQYFGHLTNEIVYRRLAPGILDELKRVTPRDAEGKPTAKYFQSLTKNHGYRKLGQHLGAVIALMKISKTWPEFLALLDQHYPRYGDTMALPYDDGKGI